jgi:cell division protein FtsX
MKTSKQAVLILVSSPFLWIGAAGALVSISAYYLLYSGHLQPLAGLADALHLGIYVFPFLALILASSICLVMSGLIVGTVRYCRKLNEKTAAKPPEHPQ